VHSPTVVPAASPTPAFESPSPPSAPAAGWATMDSTAPRRRPGRRSAVLPSTGCDGAQRVGTFVLEGVWFYFLFPKTQIKNIKSNRDPHSARPPRRSSFQSRPPRRGLLLRVRVDAGLCVFVCVRARLVV
jgi:hypothetical protein